MIGNHIHHLGEEQRFEHGIYCQSARGTVIADNVINDIASGYGIHLFGDCDGTRIIATRSPTTASAASSSPATTSAARRTER